MLKRSMLVAAALFAFSGAGCTTAGPYITNISSDGDDGLTVEKCEVHHNAFMGTVSTGECHSYNLRLRPRPRSTGSEKE